MRPGWRDWDVWRPGRRPGSEGHVPRGVVSALVTRRPCHICGSLRRSEEMGKRLPRLGSEVKMTRRPPGKIGFSRRLLGKMGFSRRLLVGVSVLRQLGWGQ